MSRKEKDFKFYMPVELEKSKNEEGEDVWEVKGIASTGDQDLQGEAVDQEGLDISVLKAGRGLFNWDHQKGPENVIGQIEDADFIDQEGKKSLMVKGYLFKQQPRAQAFYNILKSLKKGSGPRVHMSIEGKILQRCMENQKNIRKARVEKVALTMDPVNPYTYVDLVKSLNTEVPLDDVMEESEEISLPRETVLELVKGTLDALKRVQKLKGKNPEEKGDYESKKLKLKNIDESAKKMRKERVDKNEELTAEKALAAGAGGEKAPEARSGGEALTTESLESQVKNTQYKKDKKKRKEMLKSLIIGLCEKFPEMDPLEVAEYTARVFEEKYLKKGK